MYNWKNKKDTYSDLVTPKVNKSENNQISHPSIEELQQEITNDEVTLMMYMDELYKEIQESSEAKEGFDLVRNEDFFNQKENSPERILDSVFYETSAIIGAKISYPFFISRFW